MSNRRSGFVLCAAAAILSFTLVGCHVFKTADNPIDDPLIAQYVDVVKSEKYILHALGGMEGQYTYVNSIDCLEENYAAGYRLFEVDVSYPSRATAN